MIFKSRRHHTHRHEAETMLLSAPATRTGAVPTAAAARAPAHHLRFVTRRLATSAALVAVGAGAMLTGAPERVHAQEAFRLDGDRVAVHNLAGRVDIVSGTGSDVVVRVTRGGSEGDRLEARVDVIDGRTALRVVYPADEIVYRDGDRGRFSSRVNVRSDGTFGRSGRSVRVRSSGSGLDAHADLRIEVPAGRDLAVHQAVGRVDARGIRSALSVDIGAGHVTAYDIVGRVAIDTGSGGVEVGSVEGDVEVDTGSGSVTLDGVRGTSVHVDTGSGTVTLGRVEADRVLVDTGSGGIRLNDVAALDVELDTGSGSVRGVLTGRVERLVVDTGSGSVTLALPDGLDADVQLETGSGNIQVDFPIEVRIMRRDLVEGRIGQGRGLIQVDTGSGSINLRRN